jgi:pilus biogenesis lipoprotein CpaD
MADSRTAARKGSSRRRLGVAVAIGAALLAAACVPPAGNPDYRDAHPIKAEKRAYTTAVRMADDGRGVRREDMARFEVFVGDYLRRGRSALYVATPPGDGEADQEGLAESMLQRLVASGVRPEDVVFRSGFAPEGPERVMLLSFRGYGVEVPECGDWSGHTGFNPTNLQHTNYGCSYQRNIGLMLSDPGDLERTARPGTRDPARVDDIMKKHRAGKPTEAELPKASQ